MKVKWINAPKPAARDICLANVIWNLTQHSLAQLLWLHKASSPHRRNTKRSYLNPSSELEASPLCFWSLGLRGEECLATTPKTQFPVQALTDWFFLYKVSAKAANGGTADRLVQAPRLRKLPHRCASLLSTVTVLLLTVRMTYDKLCDQALAKVNK